MEGKNATLSALPESHDPNQWRTHRIELEGRALETDSRYVLLLEGRNLIIRDRQGSKRSRVCGVNTSKQSLAGASVDSWPQMY
jgi:hypothetical protein